MRLGRLHWPVVIYLMFSERHEDDSSSLSRPLDHCDAPTNERHLSCWYRWSWPLRIVEHLGQADKRPLAVSTSPSSGKLCSIANRFPMRSECCPLLAQCAWPQPGLLETWHNSPSSVLGCISISEASLFVLIASVSTPDTSSCHQDTCFYQVRRVEGKEGFGFPQTEKRESPPFSRRDSAHACQFSPRYQRIPHSDRDTSPHFTCLDISFRPCMVPPPRRRHAPLPPVLRHGAAVTSAAVQ